MRLLWYVVELVRRVSLQNRTGPLHLADFHFVFIWQTGLFLARLQVILCKIIRTSENQPGSGLKSFINTGNSSLLEQSLHFFKQAPHGLACLQINDNFRQKIHCVSWNGPGAIAFKLTSSPYTSSPVDLAN